MEEGGGQNREFEGEEGGGKGGGGVEGRMFECQNGEVNWGR